MKQKYIIFNLELSNKPLKFTYHYLENYKEILKF